MILILSRVVPIPRNLPLLLFVQFGRLLFELTIGIPMGTNCTPLLADLFLYVYEEDFL
jgi:hypothetical protein